MLPGRPFGIVMFHAHARAFAAESTVVDELSVADALNVCSAKALPQLPPVETIALMFQRAIQPCVRSAVYS